MMSCCVIYQLKTGHSEFPKTVSNLYVYNGLNERILGAVKLRDEGSTLATSMGLLRVESSIRKGHGNAGRRGHLRSLDKGDTDRKLFNCWRQVLPGSGSQEPRDLFRHWVIRPKYDLGAGVLDNVGVKIA